MAIFSQKLTHFRRERGKLRRQFHVLRDAPGVIPDHFFRRLRFGDFVLPLNQLLQRDNVVTFVTKRLRNRVAFFARQDWTHEFVHVHFRDFFRERFLARQDRA